jgi:hypothetical protein
MLGNHRAAAKLVASRVVLSFTELVSFDRLTYYYKQTNKQTPWDLVRKRTIPTDDRHLLAKFSVNFCG